MAPCCGPNSSKPNQFQTKPDQENGLGFSWIPSSNSGLFNGLRPVQREKEKKKRKSPRGDSAARERASINGPLEPAHLALRLLRAAVSAEGWRRGFDGVGQEVF